MHGLIGVVSAEVKTDKSNHAWVSGARSWDNTSSGPFWSHCVHSRVTTAFHQLPFFLPRSPCSSWQHLITLHCCTNQASTEQPMSDLPRLHAQATRLILGLREGLERLEAAEVCWCQIRSPRPEFAATVTPTPEPLTQAVLGCSPPIYSMDLGLETRQLLHGSCSRSCLSCRYGTAVRCCKASAF